MRRGKPREKHIYLFAPKIVLFLKIPNLDEKGDELKKPNSQFSKEYIGIYCGCSMGNGALGSWECISCTLRFILVLSQ